MARKRITRIVLIVAGVFVFLSATLVAHIYMVTAKPKTNSDLALSRIDIKQEISAEQQIELRRQVNALPGIYKVYINPESRTLIYGYYRNEQSPKAVYASVSQSSNIALEKFEVSEEDLAKGCPAFDENSFTFKVGAFVQNVIH